MTSKVLWLSNSLSPWIEITLTHQRLIKQSKLFLPFIYSSFQWANVTWWGDGCNVDGAVIKKDLSGRVKKICATSYGSALKGNYRYLTPRVYLFIFIFTLKFLFYIGIEISVGFTMLY